MSEIILRDICKSYENGFQAVKNFNLEIEKGELVVFVGPSGCGKSTTLRMIAGLEDISDGELWIGDKLVNYLEPKERDLAMVFQSYALYPQMNIYDNIAFSLQVRKVPKKEIDKKVHHVAELLGLENLLKQRPKNLSGGQRQRVAIGNAIIREPKVLLMDEPLSNLDAKLRTQMRVELAGIHKALGNTIIYVTHDQTEAMTLGTRIVVMKDGVVQQVDTPQNLFRYPANQFVAGFIGTPPMNFMEGVFEYKNQQLAVRTNDGIAIPLTEEKVKHALERADVAGKAVVAGIRPEHLRLLKDGEEEASFVSGEVDVYEMLGSEAIVYVKQSGNENRIIAKVDADTQLKPGDKIRLAFDLEKVHVFDKLTGQTITN